MWKLVSKKTGDAFYLLSEKENYTVGRFNSDLFIQNDTSISRNHARLIPSDNFVDVIDVGSKFNTYCNENIENKIPLEKNTQFRLNDGERVKFGQLESEFILTKMKIVTVHSNLSDKQSLIQVMQIIKGQIQNNITPECTHLTMNEITITMKLLHALIDGIPIVTPKFWIDYLKAARIGNNLPKPCDYLPNIGENFYTNKENFKFKEERKTLFTGKIFIFMNKKTFDVYSNIIEKAGGQSRALNKKICLTDLSKKNVIVIQFTSSSQSQEATNTIDKISDFLKKKSLRLVPDYEIGLALLNCSIQKYCNTQCNIELFKQNTLKEKFSESNNLEILAEETPDLSKIQKNTRFAAVEIPETVSSTVYDLTESDGDHPDLVNSDCIENNSQDQIFKMILDKDASSKEQETVLCAKTTLNKSSENQNLEIQNKRKREISPFQDKNRLSKKLNVEIENNPEPLASSSKTIKNSKPLSGFLEKSLINKKSDGISSQSNSCNQSMIQNTTKQKKRRRFAKLESDDENDGEDLFDFGRSQKKKRTVIDSDDDFNNSDDEPLFTTRKNISPNKNLSMRQTKTTTAQKSPIPHSSASIQNILKQSYTKERNKSETPKEPISTIGWLSKQVIKCTIKEENIKEENIKEENDKSTTDTKSTVDTAIVKLENDSKWIDSLKNVFEVRVKPMILVSKISNLSDLTDNSKSLNTTGKNFKAFVKKQNFKPQKEVLSTVPYHVTGFSF